MKEFLRKLVGQKIYLLVAALIIFALAFLVNTYVIGTSSAHYYTRQIQSDIQSKEHSFQELAADSALLSRIVSKTYTEDDLNAVLDSKTGYYIYIFRPDTTRIPELLFWNTQVTLPPVNLMEDSDASRMVRLDNGLYVSTSKSVLLQGKRYVVEALIPVTRQYFVELENLPKEFVSFPKAGSRVDVVFEPTTLVVRSSFGNILFYLQKLDSKAEKTSWWLVAIILAGVFLIFVYIQQTAHFLYERYGIQAGAGFLLAVIILLRLISYASPDLLNLKQFELFDPAIYSSSFLLGSLGDLLINALLVCWIVMFVNSRLPGVSLKLSKHPIVNLLLVLLSMLILVAATFSFTGVLQSLVADAQISFNVTNFFSLTFYSFVGFVILAVMALTYFFLIQMLLAIARAYNQGPWYIPLLVIAAIGLFVISLTRNPAVVEVNLYSLLWLVMFVLVMQQKIFSGLNFRLNISEVLFWMFVFAFSIAAVIIFENRKIEFEQRLRFAEKLAIQSDPSSERLLSIALAYLDNDFLAPNFDRFSDPEENRHIKDSIINKNFSE